MKVFFDFFALFFIIVQKGYILHIHPLIQLHTNSLCITHKSLSIISFLSRGIGQSLNDFIFTWELQFCSMHSLENFAKTFDMVIKRQRLCHPSTCLPRQAFRNVVHQTRRSCRGNAQIKWHHPEQPKDRWMAQLLPPSAYGQEFFPLLFLLERRLAVCLIGFTSPVQILSRFPTVNTQCMGEF